MPTVEYIVAYKVAAQQAIAGIKALEAELLKLDALAIKTQKSVAAVGTGTNQVTTATTKLGRLNAALATTQANASSASSSLASVGPACEAAGGHMGRAATRSDALAGGLGGIVTAGLGIRVVQQAAEALGESLNKARQYARETADENIKLRDSLREIKAMSGDKASMNDVSDSVIKMMMQTGATKDEAKNFDLEFKSSISAAQQSGHWKMNEADTAKFKEEALHFAVANGLSPAVLGKTISLMGTHEDINSPDQALAKLGSVHNAAFQAVGDTTGAFKEAQKLRGTMVRPDGTGAVKSEEELMALVATGTTDVGNVSRTAQTVNQAWRELNRFGDKKEGGKGAGDTLAKLGIKPGQSFMDRIERFKPLIDEANKPGGPGAISAMKSAGFGNTAANMKIISWVENLKILQARMAEVQGAGDPAKIPANAAKIRADLKAFDANDPDRKAEAADQGADFARGEKQRLLQSAKKAATARMKADGRIDGPANTWEESIQDLFGVAPKLGVTTARDMHLHEDVRNKLVEADPNIVKRFPALKSNFPSADELSEALNQASPEVRAKVLATPQVDAAIGALGKPGARPGVVKPGVDVNGAAGANGAPGDRGKPGPQAAIDASKLDRAADKLWDVADALKATLAQGPQRRGRASDDLGPPSDYSNPYGPYRPGSA